MTYLSAISSSHTQLTGTQVESMAFGEEWITQPALPWPRFLAGAAADATGELYVAGGVDTQGVATAEVVKFPFGSGSPKVWSNVTSMRNARAGASVHVINRTLYVIGGLDDSGAALASMETLDLSANGSTLNAFKVTALPTNVSQAASVVSGGQLYLMGGCTDLKGTTPTDSVFVLDIASGIWREGVRLPFATFGSQALVLADGDLLLWGGLNAAPAVVDVAIVFDVQRQVWRYRSTTLIQRAQAGVAQTPGTGYVVGGLAMKTINRTEGTIVPLAASNTTSFAL